MVCSFQQPVFNASFSPSGNRILVTGSLPYFFVYSNQQAIKQVKLWNGVHLQEFDTFEINRREKEMGSPFSLSTNSLVL